MRFRKKEILFWEGQIVISICLIVSVLLMMFNRMYVAILLFPSVLLLAAIILHWFLDKEFIIINEIGVSCQSGKQLCWKYQWSEIAELKLGNRFRNPTIEIVLKTDCFKHGTKFVKTYFQLGTSAKKAIKHYYNKTRDDFA